MRTSHLRHTILRARHVFVCVSKQRTYYMRVSYVFAERRRSLTVDLSDQSVVYARRNLLACRMSAYIYVKRRHIIIV